MDCKTKFPYAQITQHKCVNDRMGAAACMYKEVAAPTDQVPAQASTATRIRSTAKQI